MVLRVCACVYEFATKHNNSIERLSPKHSPLLPLPEDPMIPPCALPNFCGSFPSNIFQTRTVPFDDIVPNIVPSLNTSTASTNN